MTIVTKPLTDEKKDLKPLVVDSENGNFGMVADGQDGVSTTSDITVYQHPYRKHKMGFLVCLGLLILLIIACATMGGIYLYYRFSQPEGYRASCRIRFTNQPSTGNLIAPFDGTNSVQQDPSPFQMPSFPTGNNEGMVPPFQPARSRLLFPHRGDASVLPTDMDADLKRIINSFQQDFELDLRKQLWEILQVPRVPQLGLGRPARFIHDFNLNLTAIFDMSSRECYVMPLNRSVIKPPQDLFEFLRGLEDGSYTVDGSTVRQTYYVDPLPVMDFSTLGPFIERECSNHPTYSLISRDADSASGERVRRSTGEDHVTTFGEFVGNFHTINIIKNL